MHSMGLINRLIGICRQVYGIFDISNGLGGPYKGTFGITIYGTKLTSVPMIVGKGVPVLCGLAATVYF